MKWRKAIAAPAIVAGLASGVFFTQEAVKDSLPATEHNVGVWIDYGAQDVPSEVEKRSNELYKQVEINAALAAISIALAFSPIALDIVAEHIEKRRREAELERFEKELSFLTNLNRLLANACEAVNEAYPIRPDTISTPETHLAVVALMPVVPELSPDPDIIPLTVHPRYDPQFNGLPGSAA